MGYDTSRRMFPSHIYPSRSVFLEDFRYDQTLIRVMVVIAYLGWAAYGATAILFPNQPPSFDRTISGAALAALGISWTLFAIQKYPATFHIYAVFPCYFWRETLVASSGPLNELYRSGKLRGSVKLSLRAVLVIAALQAMVVRATAFTERSLANLNE
jgi:phosphatidylinositol glycan class N